MLLMRIDRHLRRTKTPASRFGRDAVGDPGFVQGLRDGREPRRRTRERVLAYIDARERVLAAEESAR